MHLQPQLLQINLSKYKDIWLNIELSNLITGYDSNGVRFLSQFLQDYTLVFSESVNAGCNKCLSNYLLKYKLKFQVMENTSKYILKKKYEGISLNDTSSVMVNNRNITDEYAQELLLRFKAEEIFEAYPKVEEIIVKDAEIIKEQIKTKLPKIIKK